MGNSSGAMSLPSLTSRQVFDFSSSTADFETLVAERHTQQFVCHAIADYALTLRILRDEDAHRDGLQNGGYLRIAFLVAQIRDNGAYATGSIQEHVLHG